jgi:hypothetical protein
VVGWVSDVRATLAASKGSKVEKYLVKMRYVYLSRYCQRDLAEKDDVQRPHRRNLLMGDSKTGVFTLFLSIARSPDGPHIFLARWSMVNYHEWPTHRAGDQ